MDKVKVYYDRKGNSLTVWFDDPSLEHICDEVDDDVVLIKDKQERVIGVERLNYLTDPTTADDDGVPLEIQTL